MTLALLDSDTLSELLKQRNPQVVTKAAEYLRFWAGPAAATILSGLHSRMITGRYRVPSDAR